eukprot:13012021-Heterocapsa_arctica.AAC.1
MIARDERHGGITKSTMKTIVMEYHIIDKLQRKQAAAVATQVKDESLRRGGFRPSQWAQEKHLHRPGSLAEEAEWGQHVVLEAQQKPDTEFHIRAAMRLPVQKAYLQGDWVMYLAVQGARAPGSEWAGPVPVIGMEKDVLWRHHGGVPVASAMHLLRPSSTAELLACPLRAHTSEETEHRKGYIDHRTGQPSQLVPA